eukprot:764631-Pyramimonas_sp.AAC.1
MLPQEVKEEPQSEDEGIKRLGRAELGRKHRDLAGRVASRGGDGAAAAAGPRGPRRGTSAREEEPQRS